MERFRGAVSSPVLLSSSPVRWASRGPSGDLPRGLGGVTPPLLCDVSLRSLGLRGCGDRPEAVRQEEEHQEPQDLAAGYLALQGGARRGAGNEPGVEPPTPQAA